MTDGHPSVHELQNELARLERLQLHGRKVARAVYVLRWVLGIEPREPSTDIDCLMPSRSWIELHARPRSCGACSGEGVRWASGFPYPCESCDGRGQLAALGLSGLLAGAQSPDRRKGT